MRRLIQFLIYSRYTFLFLVLESLALYLVFVFNPFQRLSSQAFFLTVSTWYNENLMQLRSYFFLKQENEKLLSAYMNLQQRVNELENKIAYYENRVPLTSKLIYQEDTEVVAYRYIPGEIIYNQLSHKKNFFIMNKGRKAGILPNMGVVASEGVAGLVKEVTDHFAICVSLLNSDLFLSIRIRPLNVLASFTWEGDDPAYGTVKYIPSHYPVTEGQEIVTSGFGPVFPKNIRIGTIVDVVADQEKNGFIKAKVKLATNFHELYYVYAVVHKQKAELDSLQRE